MSRCCSISLLSNSSGTPLMRALCSFVLSFAFGTTESPPKNSGFQDFKTMSASSTVKNSKSVLPRANVKTYTIFSSGKSFANVLLISTLSLNFVYQLLPKSCLDPAVSAVCSHYELLLWDQY